MHHLRFAMGSFGLLALFALLAGPISVLAADPGDPAEAFRQTDRNRDGYVDRGEFQQRAVELFFFADADRDGRATAADLDRVTLDPGGSAAADRDGDGWISLPEFLELRLARFRGADADGDGRLSRAEVEASYAAR